MKEGMNIFNWVVLHTFESILKMVTFLLQHILICKMLRKFDQFLQKIS